MDIRLVVAVVAAASALAGSVLGAFANRWSAGFTAKRQDRREKEQRDHQDRREKRARVHASFKRVLMAAKTIAGMTAPYQIAGGGAWAPEREMSEEARQRFYDIVDRSTNDLREAVVDLTLEGITEPVEAVEEMMAKFIDFRWRRQKEQLRESDEVIEDVRKIAEIRGQLEAKLPQILDQILKV